jgi:hypothetical protein
MARHSESIRWARSSLFDAAHNGQRLRARREGIAIDAELLEKLEGLAAGEA